MNPDLFSALGLHFTRWAEPSDDGELYEAVTPEGRVILAGSVRDIILAATKDKVVAFVPPGRVLTFSCAA